jgi:xylose isomerase
MSIFSDIDPIRYEGPSSTNPLAFRYYDKDRVVAGRRMEDHLRYAVCFWHSFSWPGSDVFGAGTLPRPWLAGPIVTQTQAQDRLDAAFDFFTRLGAPYFCFHDVDVAATGSTLREQIDNLAHIEPLIADKIAVTGVKLLWGTANLFSHPRYAAGGATNPDPDVFACAAAQVRAALETTHRLGGENYVLWGGREGYETLLNTDLVQEANQMARFLHMVVEHKHKIGFKGLILLEPKPHEPSKHQYDRDAATCAAFLLKHGLQDEVKLNIEANHATLAGNTFEHEIATAIAYGLFGSVDINRGDPQNGWDTDQFHNDPRELALVWRHILKAGGLTSGGFNFDAKLRRQSVAPEDLFYGHIGGIDALAQGLLAGAALLEDGKLDQFTQDRYAGWHSSKGQEILSGALTLEQLADRALSADLNPSPRSGRQEMLENLINRFV